MQASGLQFLCLRPSLGKGVHDILGTHLPADGTLGLTTPKTKLFQHLPSKHLTPVSAAVGQAANVSVETGS